MANLNVTITQFGNGTFKISGDFNAVASLHGQGFYTLTGDIVGTLTFNGFGQATLTGTSVNATYSGAVALSFVANGFGQVSMSGSIGSSTVSATLALAGAGTVAGVVNIQSSGTNVLAYSPLAWYKVDRLPVVSDGTAISAVSDLSGNGINLGQATGTRQPLYKTNIFGSKPALLFDGSNDILTAASNSLLDLTGNFSIFAAIKTIDNFGGIVGRRDASSPFNGWVFTVGVGVAANKMTFYGNTGSWLGDSATISDNAIHVAEVTRVSGTVTFYIDGIAGASGARSNTTTSATFFVGGDVDAIATPSGSNSLNFYLAEMIIFGSGFNSQAIIRSYLKSEWGTP